MKAIVTGLCLLLGLAACESSTNEAWDIAASAEAEAQRANERIKELENRIDDLESRIEDVEYNMPQ